MKRSSKLEQKLSEQLENRKTHSRFRQLTTSSPESVDFSSNDFLSLSTSPDLRKAFLHELQNGPQGDNFPLGSGGSRLLDGNSKYADDLEKSIAQFHGAPAGLLWNSGFDANSGLFACIPQLGDVIIYDELIHASVHDGMKLSRASKKMAFEHNSVANLEKAIRTAIGELPKIGRGESSVFVAIESIYSMDGDIAPLAAIVALVERLLSHGNGHIIIDEAHSTGVLGSFGKGLVCELGLENKVFARLHTFGKSLACSGVNYARPLIFTTFMPFLNLAAIKASYSMLQSGQTEPLRNHLNELTKSFYNQLKSTLLRRNLVKDTTEILQIPLQCPKSPIFALQTPSPKSLATFCQEEGFVVRAVVPPTVPTRRVRVCLHAANTKEQIEGLVDRIDLWLGTQLGNGILPSIGPGAMGQFEEDIATITEEKSEAQKEAEEDDDFVKAMI